MINPPPDTRVFPHAADGAKFRRNRQMIGLTLRDVAGVLNLSMTDVSAIERGEFETPPIALWGLLDYAISEVLAQREIIKQMDGAE